jgi:hypothetical protein
MECLMSVQTFTDLESMSRHQDARELAEALRVHAMTTDVYSEWLRCSLDPLQKLTIPALAAGSASGTPQQVRFFPSQDEKQRYDEARELDLALRLALSRSPDDGLL